MKNRQYAPIWKNIGLIIQITLTVIFVMSVFLLSALIGKNMLDTTDVSNGNFLDSGYYSELFEEKTDELIGFLKLRNKFEIDGEYEPQKLVDIMQYSLGNTLTERAETQSHTLVVPEGDSTFSYSESIVDNAKTGADGAEASTQNDSGAGGTADKDTADADTDTADADTDTADADTDTASADVDGTEIAVDEGSLSPEAIEKEYRRQKEEQEKVWIQRVMSYYVLDDLITWSKTGYTKSYGVLDEEYLPIGGKSIAEALVDGNITQEQAESLYQGLEATLSVIGTEEKSYKKGLNEFQKEETNLTYAYSENGQLIYSNYKVEEDLLAYARSQGSYLYYNDEDLKFRSNIKDMDTYFYNSLDDLLSRVGNSAKLMIAVDTKMPFEDDFANAQKEFYHLYPWVMRSIVSIVVSLFGWVVTLVYLTTAAGHVVEDTKIHLNFFDKIKTELFFVLFVLLNVTFLTISFGVARSTWDIPGMLVMAGVSAFIIDMVFLLCYLSIVRRVKAGVLWEYSLLYWILRSTKRVARTWRSSIRVILLYGLGVLLFLFLAYESFDEKSVLAITVLFMLIAAAGITYLRDVVQQQEIMSGIEKITDGDLAYKLPLDNLHGDKRELAEAVNRIGDGLRNAVDESTKNERMKADLITNVSHDIKTPLTSIINYVNLLKLEKIEEKRTRDYIHILDEKSQRLRQLTEDLVEASRISSGNITLQMSEINLVELIYQTGGEFNEKFEDKGLTTITKLPKEAAIIMADGRRIWRVVENLYNNVAKYAMPNTRVYVKVEKTKDEVSFSIKNVSEQQLNVESVDLTERFIRGDEARTTEGSGLGLSIARNLTTMMDGKFELELDGDVFTATIIFPLVNK